jgi:two-component system response regulator AtoC
MHVVQQKVERLRNTNIPVCIRGESGTGKETLAFAIYSRLLPESGPFVKINCSSVPESLFESGTSEVPGGYLWHEKEMGARRPECADGWTLFLDGIADLDAGEQTKFLQKLLEVEGRNTEHHSPRVRFISATNRDLEAEVEAGRFRQDLFYRINAFDIWLPPLRQRALDIPDLVDHFLKLHSEKKDVPPRPVSSELLGLMQKYHWPGNIRELENLVRRYVILGSEQIVAGELLLKIRSDITPEHEAGQKICLKKLTRQVTRDVERRLILKVLENSGWNRKLAAQCLNISYRALLYKIKQGGMPAKRRLILKPRPAMLDER